MDRDIFTESLVHRPYVTGLEPYASVLDALMKNLNLFPSFRSSDKALFIFMMDVSGSMGAWEKHMCRCLYAWISRILKQFYRNIEVRLIAHHTEAVICATEEDLFEGQQPGGTICSTAYDLAHKAILEHQGYDCFVIHGSDGDNLSSDNIRVLDRIQKMEPMVHTIFYFEVNQFRRTSTLMAGLRSILGKSPYKFNYFVMHESPEMYEAILTYFCSLPVFMDSNENASYLLYKDDLPDPLL